ncbi:hypothetical protein SAMN05421788_10434 [Filimonas lacunae]|uniref:Quercetin 2,3-dioxygenase C-terminal cupin domain-containing protein n=2 Tax=Filimonas lacunae TaxID=477680 RepID=A0A173M9L9_9BACT|nr:pirin family protein [Filimonas lacunae]SIT13756.1 hypothetical protein SAMN05421788_10434 [Filimonas lacunae]
MYLADERGCSQADWFRSMHTFNFGQFDHPHKTAAGPLYVLNDDTLAGQRSVDLLVKEDSEVLLMPLVGCIVCKNGKGFDEVIEAGDCFKLLVKAGTTLTLTNPYRDELVNYLVLWYKKPVKTWEKKISCFDVFNYRNRFLDLFPGSKSPKYYIGKFGGRAELLHRLASPHNAVFIFVLEGAFEVQYRLLHARDGLLLWDVHEVELEALSSDAIILAVEFSV